MRLRDLFEFGIVGVGRSPDYSGVRGGLPRPPQERGEGYPYDRDELAYGQPAAYDRGSGGRGPSHQQLTPKDTSHSAWEDLEGELRGDGGLRKQEAMGTPMSVGKAGNAQMGNATGVPGADGSWANSPKTFRYISFADLDHFGKTVRVEPAPEEGDGPFEGVFVSPGPEDRTLRGKDERVPGAVKIPSQKTGDIFVVGGGSVSGDPVASSLRPSRGRYGLIPKESVWPGLARLLSRE